MRAEITITAPTLKAVQTAAADMVEAFAALGWESDGFRAARSGDERTITVLLWRKE